MAVPDRTRPAKPRRQRRSVIRAVAVLAVMACGSLLTHAPALAQISQNAQHVQGLTFPKRPEPLRKSTTLDRDQAGKKQMLVQAREINYDYNNHRVAAVGNVQIYYGTSTLEADKVVYDQNTKRLRAEGNVRLTEADGKITYGTVMEMSDDYRDGFIDSLRLETPDQTRMAAARAERSKGNFTVFHNGVYTACPACKDDPKKPPLWQVKAARIIHDQNEKMIYFEGASLEFFGKPIAYLPYFSAPDPTVKRKSGVLMPSVTSNSKYGVAVEVPYYFALAPDYDATLAPMVTSKQGVLMQGEFRQRLINGAYTIRAAGISQANPSYFVRDDGTATPGNRDTRGSIESSGQFAITNKWIWGWDALMLSDRTFLQDYNPQLSRYRVTDPLQNSATEGVSQVYLTGKGDRSYFDIRSIYYLGFSEADVQGQIPVIHPVIDYNYTFGYPVLGGELSYKMNLTSLTRQQASFDAITKAALTAGNTTPPGSLTPESACLTADTAVKNQSNCLLRGAPGSINRASAEFNWRRSITDRIGQVWTPFASVRVDAASQFIDNDPSVGNYVVTGQSDLVRAMPTVGLEYRYPFLSAHSWGTQTLEPIGQIIVRPNETQVGRWMNEDSQSFTFDDSNLFSVNKFAGYDRVEGGGRANYGVHYTAQFNQGGFIDALFGQSYSLFGQNSFAVTDATNTGLDSGLDSRASDYVGRVSYQPNSTYKFTSRARFAENGFSVQRFELETDANFDRWSTSLLYGDYAAQPDIGFLDRRQGVLGTATYKLDANWVLLGGARYDIINGKFDQTRMGIGYIDDCLILALNYITNYTYSGNVTSDHQIMLQIGLRTLGGTSFSSAGGF